jgi:hypothetical protein
VLCEFGGPSSEIRDGAIADLRFWTQIARSARKRFLGGGITDTPARDSQLYVLNQVIDGLHSGCLIQNASQVVETVIYEIGIKRRNRFWF